MPIEEIFTGDTIDNNSTKSINALLLKEEYKKLSQMQKAVIGLKICGYTQDDISELLGFSRTSIWATQKKTLLLLKDKLCIPV